MDESLGYFSQRQQIWGKDPRNGCDDMGENASVKPVNAIADVVNIWNVESLPFQCEYDDSSCILICHAGCVVSGHAGITSPQQCGLF
jgi:hypothetical protein